MATSEAGTAAVIISTRDRAAMLEDTLISLVADSSRVRREIIVVDNGSRDATVEVVSRLQTKMAPDVITYLRHEHTGKASALNAAVATTRADYLVFTDDDVMVQPGWIDALTAPFADRDVAVVGGRTVPIWPVGGAPGWLDGRLAEDLGLRDYGDANRPLEPYGVVGVNMALRRSALAHISGPFEVSLGPTVPLKIDYEEFHLISCLAADHRVVYAPNAVIRHRVDAARLDWGWMRRMYFQRGVGAARHMRLSGVEMPTLKGSVWLLAGSYSRARLLSIRHAVFRQRTSAAAHAEFFSYLLAGQHLEALFGNRPRLCLRLAVIMA